MIHKEKLWQWVNGFAVKQPLFSNLNFFLDDTVF